MSARERVTFEGHPLAAYLPPWELERIDAAYERVRGEWSLRAEPAKLDRDAFLVGWVASLKEHHYAGWKDGQVP